MFSFRNQCLVNSAAEQNGIDGHWMKISPLAPPRSSSGDVQVSNSFSFDIFLQSLRREVLWLDVHAAREHLGPNRLPKAMFLQQILFFWGKTGNPPSQSLSWINWRKKLKSSCVQATSLRTDNGDFILSLFAFSNFTTVETEQLIYPLSSLVKYTCNVSEESSSMNRDKEI